MGQANSEGLQSRSLLIKIWVPIDRDANVFLHRATQEQVQRHFIRILLKDLPRETALFAARKANHHPYICRLLYFHPSIPEQNFAQDHERDFREIFIYTDITLPMRAWNCERVVAALQGLRRLISIHGPIKITERMISQNQTGEVNVWISENPVNNHPDSKYMSEEQSMGDFAAVLTKNNQELANYLMGCITLKQAFQCLSNIQHQSQHLHQNYSRRASGSGDFKHILQIKDQNLVTPYKNVFGRPTHSVVTNIQEKNSPNNTLKSNLKNPQSLFVPKEIEKIKPVTQINDFSKYRYFLIPKRIPGNDSKIGNKSNPKLNANDYSVQYRKSQDFNGKKHAFQHTKLNETSFDMPKRGADYTPVPNSHSNKSIAFQHRFQTLSGANLHIKNHISPKSKIESNWNKHNQIKNLYSRQNQYPKEQKRQKGFKEQKVKTGGLGFTIINNNVNNYISNIIHNHITKIQKAEKDNSQPNYQETHQFKKYQKMTHLNNRTLNSNQFMKQSQKTKERKQKIPVFLHQKIKSSTQWPQESAKNNQKLKNDNLSRKNTVSSNPSYDSLQFSSENNLDKLAENSTKRFPGEQKFLRSFNVSKDNQSSTSTQKTASFFNMGDIYPLTPPFNKGYQGFTFFQKNQNNFQFKMPPRTKTMQFHQKVKGVQRNEELQNKSFTQAELQKSSNQIKVNEKKGQYISAHVQSRSQDGKNVEENIKYSQKQQQQKKAQNRLQFTKQLRNQFKNLLGGDVKQNQQQPVIISLAVGSIEQKTNVRQVRELNLKQKISRKKTAFAELKKEALHLLIDE